MSTNTCKLVHQFVHISFQFQVQPFYIYFCKGNLTLTIPPLQLIRGGDRLNMNNRIPADSVSWKTWILYSYDALFLLHASTKSIAAILQEDRTVVGFDTPRSPDSSYNNVYPVTEDETRDPPLVPQQLQHPLLGYPATRDMSENLPTPLNALLNHLYIENRTEAPRSVVALGFTHRFRSKYVSVVLYKAVRSSRGPSSWLIRVSRFGFV